jgi:ATP-dependent Clp protease ATP-binding subunit ClpA
MQLETQLAERNVTFDLHSDAIAWLADKGYDEKMGARPLARVIQESVKKPLADEILFGKLKKGGVVKVTVGIKADGTKGLILDYVPETARIKPKAEVVAPVRKSTKAAKPKEMETVGAEPDGGAKPKKVVKAAAKAEEPASAAPAEAPRKGRTVPKVPRKK